MKDRPNLQIIKTAHVKSIIFENKRTVGVNFVYNDTIEMTVRAKKEVILSAGVIGTPKLLMLSGIEPADHLTEMNILVVKDLPVGENPQYHLLLPVFYRFNRKKESLNLIGDYVGYVEDINLLTYLSIGPLTGLNAADLVGFINTLNPNASVSDCQIYHLAFSKRADELKLFLSGLGFNDAVQK